MTSTMQLKDFAGIPELKAQLEVHPVYASVKNIEQLRTFMEHHIYSVWDFMSLLKCLQRDMAPATSPWLPTQRPDATLVQRFINEIVLGEETDENLPNAKDGSTYISHFDLYVGAMEEIGADTRPIKAFIKSVQKNGIEKALKTAKIPEPSRQFMRSTFEFIASGKPHVVAAAFSLGREQVIPSMFRALLADMKISKKKAPLFHYYLERHIHLDDELHGPLSIQLLEHLCGTNRTKMRAVATAGRNAIQARIQFWDGVTATLNA